MKKETAKLNRVAGQVKALSNMVESGADCGDLIVQFQAAQSALSAVFNDVLNKNLKNYIAKRKQKEINEVVKQICKSK